MKHNLKNRLILMEATTRSREHLLSYHKKTEEWFKGFATELREMRDGRIVDEKMTIWTLIEKILNDLTLS